MSKTVTSLQIKKDVYNDTYYLYIGYADGNFVEIPRCNIKNLNQLVDIMDFDPFATY